jgi:hypothetical protein
MTSDIFSSVFELEAKLGTAWPNIRAARDRTVDLHTRLAEGIGDGIDADASVVVFGSAGRYEVTDGSDTDWTYLVDGQAKTTYQAEALKVAEVVRSVSQEPGREGVFGSLTFSNDLVQYIGGHEDTNANLTQRILLLLESKPIRGAEVYSRVVRVILERYLTSDYGWVHGTNPYGVPRFMHNDIARYWRTVAVDFAYKQWTRAPEGWALRSAKLRFSRKVTYAAGLLYCFSLARQEAGPSDAPREPPDKFEAILHLTTLTLQTPLDILARAYASSPGLLASAAKVFDSYDAFLGILTNAEERRYLKQLSPDDTPGDETFQRVRELGHRFQQGLDELFLPEAPTHVSRLTKGFGLF